MGGFAALSSEDTPHICVPPREAEQAMARECGATLVVSSDICTQPEARGSHRVLGK